MNQLWAPWRMAYLDETESEPGCLFCRIAGDDADVEHHVLYRTGRCLVMLNLYPYNSGHLMVVPYQHTGQIEQIKPETAAEMFGVTQLSASILRRVMEPDGFNVGINQGTVAGAGIADHVHLHVVPRWSGDTNFMPVLGETKVMPEMLAATAAKLRPLFQSAGQPG